MKSWISSSNAFRTEQQWKTHVELLLEMFFPFAYTRKLHDVQNTSLTCCRESKMPSIL